MNRKPNGLAVFVLLEFLVFFAGSQDVLNAQTGSTQETSRSTGAKTAGVTTGATGAATSGRNIGWRGSGTENGTSNFANPAQATHAANLAMAAAQNDPQVQAAFASVSEAQRTLDSLKNKSDEGDIKGALAKLAEAEKKAEAELARMAGVDKTDIEAMRGDGMGWGEIAHALGLHPGVLAIGHSKGGEQSSLSGKRRGSPSSEILMATARATSDAAFEKEHVAGRREQRGGKGLGLGFVSAAGDHQRRRHGGFAGTGDGADHSGPNGGSGGNNR